MTEPLFNIEVFNQKTTQDKIDYLYNCVLSLPEKSFHDSPYQHENKIKALVADVHKPESVDMYYMLNLMTKYNVLGCKEDHLIIKEYEDYVKTKKSSM